MRAATGGSQPDPTSRSGAPGRGGGPPGDGGPGPAPPSAPVAAPAVSLPTGGGAIRGIGEKFTANPVTGAGSLTVPLPLPEGRDGLGPELTLEYDSTAGNGAFGFGWRLDVPAVTRQTDRGVPRYGDADVFVLSGAEDLVPVPGPDQTRHGYAVRRYRPRVETAFTRVERWTRLADGDTHWRTITRENALAVYGFDAASRIADPDHPERVFSWLVCARYDDRGNAVGYEYAAEDGSGVDDTAAAERHRAGRPRSRTANRYLKRVRYGNRAPLLLDPAVEGFRPPHVPAPDPTTAGWMFEVVLDYGEGHHRAQPPDPDGRVLVEADAGVPPGGAWRVRSDAFSRYRSGFEVRTYRLCRAILVFHHFPDELGVEDYLARAVRLQYEQTPVGSFLREILSCGYARQADGRYLERRLPALSCRYTDSPLAAAEEVPVEVRDVAGGENLPEGVDGVAYQWVDLDGEGIDGVLAQHTGGWLYKPNLGGGRLGPALPVAPLPAAGAAAPVATRQVVDLTGDGLPELVELDPGGAGFYPRTGDNAWAPFRQFGSWPRLSWTDGTARLADTTGDGLADILVAGADHLTWYGSLGRDGFGPPVRVPVPADEDLGPRVVFADPTRSVHLADMSGDGMPDIARIRNGEVCYWPNLGYGQFGAKVTMDNPPRLDHPDRFDPRRVRLADTDGSGTADLVYLDPDGVRVYLNGSGNGWSDARVLRGFPAAGGHTSIGVADLLGRGTACLVWSSPLPGDARRPVRYADLMAGRKPHLLSGFRNGLGAEIVVEYTSSTEFYLSDRAAGRPWASRLPFPVHVVSRVDRLDHIGRNRYTSRYRYHHGHFDAVEREWRGFGRVDQLDTEELAALGGDGTGWSNLDASSHVPPVETRSWYHTGAYTAGGRISRHLAGEYYHGPGSGEELLDDTVLPPGLTAGDSREACRALKGLLLRREVYAHDGGPAAARPYTVSERNYALRPLQPGVFLPHPRETVDLHYERRLYQVAGETRADPRVRHELALEADDYGNVLLGASVAYGRRFADPDPRLSGADRDAQARTSVRFTVRELTQPVTGEQVWRTPLPYRTSRYELHRAVPAGRRFTFDELCTLIDTASDGGHDLPPEDVDATRATGPDPFRRLLHRERVSYRRNDLTGPATPGTAESLALPDATYRLALTPGLATIAYGDRLTAAQLSSVLTGEGGYVQLPDADGWWARSGVTGYTPEPGGAAAELAEATGHFFRERRWTDPFGNVATVAYDPHDLFAVETRDPVGNVELFVHNYRVLQPSSRTDANSNRRTVAFDALGMVVGTAVAGKPVEGAGDSLAGFDPELTDAAVATHLADPLTGGLALLQRATTRLVYDLHAFARTGTQPPVVSTIQRETHDADPGGPASVVRCQLSYSDGFGREVQQKREAEQGRWLVTGWAIRNNKGRPVRRYEPFFDDTPGFVFGSTVGVSPILCYDPLGRVVAILHPDHTWRKAVFDAWGQETWDLNDTVLVTDPAGDPDVGDHFRRLPATRYLPTWHAARASGALGAAEQDAAGKAAAHAGTPSLAAVDPLGRTVLGVDHNRVGGADSFHRTRLVLDVEGNRRALVDANGRVALRRLVDLLGNELVTSSMEAGEHRSLYDVTGAVLRRWDSRGHVFTVGYDGLRRVLHRGVRGTDPDRSDPRTLGRDVRYERTVYGEGQPDDVARNLRTRVVAVYDGAGVDRTDRYDFKGNPLHHTRRCTADHRDLADWAGDPALDGDVWHNRATYDACDRPATLTTPDGSVTRFSYNARGLLAAVDVTPPGGGSAPVTFVTGAEYDPRGQETELDLGNGATISYRYDPLTFRPAQVTTTRPSAGDALATQLFVDATRVQDLRYTYDPTGNPTRIADTALHTMFHQNAQVKPVSSCTYDAVYRLVTATGREHVGQSAPGAQPSGGDYRDFPFAGAAALGDLTAVRTFTEQYEYDEVGNLTSVGHAAGGAGWTRTYTYAEPSLLEPGRFNNRLSRTTTPGGGTEPYTYDDHGAVTSLPHLPVLEWDFKGQLRASSRQVVNGAVTREATYYCYAASGQRVRTVTERQAGGRRRDRLSLRGCEVHREYAGDGTTVTGVRETLHVMAAARRVALVETVTVENGRPVARVPRARYQLGNHLESATLELDDGARLIGYEEYTPYGVTCYQTGRSAAEVSLKRFRYTGRERDRETGFCYHGARYYAPWLGRWTACDPAGPADGPNLYQYARSNPCRMRDPSGTQSHDEEDTPRPRGPVPAPPPPAGAEPAGAGDRSAGRPPPAGRPAVRAVDPAAAEDADAEWTSTPPEGRETGLTVGEGAFGVTKLHWQHWPGTEYHRDTGRVRGGPTWLTWVTAALFLGGMGLLVAFAGRHREDDPAGYQAVKYGATALLVALVGTRLVMEGTVSKTPEGETPKWDKQLADPWWTTIHTLTGVVMGLWQVPFPLVALATVTWEVFETTAPGFGDHEVNGNRATDIGVAWLGWAVAAGISSYVTEAPFPHGFQGRHYTEDRGY